MIYTHNKPMCVTVTHTYLKNFRAKFKDNLFLRFPALSLYATQFRNYSFLIIILGKNERACFIRVFMRVFILHFLHLK